MREREKEGERKKGEGYEYYIAIYLCKNCNYYKRIHRQTRTIMG